ncbi:hypothetical protein BH20ACI2_BH20ACI2_09880 [soil metagenome]
MLHKNWISPLNSVRGRLLVKKEYHPFEGKAMNLVALLKLRRSNLANFFLAAN